MNTRSGSEEQARTVDADILELEERLHRLADHFVERSRLGGSDAIELYDRGTVLQRAAFALRSARSAEVIDLTADPG